MARIVAWTCGQHELCEFIRKFNSNATYIYLEPLSRPIMLDKGVSSETICTIIKDEFVSLRLFAKDFEIRVLSDQTSQYRVAHLSDVKIESGHEMRKLKLYGRRKYFLREGFNQLGKYLTTYIYEDELPEQAGVNQMYGVPQKYERWGEIVNE